MASAQQMTEKHALMKAYGDMIGHLYGVLMEGLVDNDPDGGGAAAARFSKDLAKARQALTIATEVLALPRK